MRLFGLLMALLVFCVLLFCGSADARTIAAGNTTWFYSSSGKYLGRVYHPPKMNTHYFYKGIGEYQGRATRTGSTYHYYNKQNKYVGRSYSTPKKKSYSVLRPTGKTKERKSVLYAH